MTDQVRRARDKLLELLNNYSDTIDDPDRNLGRPNLAMEILTEFDAWRSGWVKGDARVPPRGPGENCTQGSAGPNYEDVQRLRELLQAAHDRLPPAYITLKGQIERALKATLSVYEINAPHQSGATHDPECQQGGD